MATTTYDSGYPLPPSTGGIYVYSNMTTAAPSWGFLKKFILMMALAPLTGVGFLFILTTSAHERGQNDGVNRYLGPRYVYFVFLFVN